MNRFLVEVRNLSKDYNGHKAVDDISFFIKEGEVFALLGPNGAGKTTTLECLEGLIKPTKGEILIDNKSVSNNLNHIRKVMGVQLQSSALPKDMKVSEAIKLFTGYHNVGLPHNILERFKLTEHMNKCYGSLSVGQQRKVVLAIAIAHKPKLLILDEPTAGLDVVTRIELHKIIEELKKENTTILLASHDMAEVEKLSDRIGVLVNGKLVKVGSPLEVSASMNKGNKIMIKLNEEDIGIKDICCESIKYSGQVEEYHVFYSTDINNMLFTLVNHLKESNNIITDLKVDRPSLEDTFIKLTEQEV